MLVSNIQVMSDRADRTRGAWGMTPASPTTGPVVAAQGLTLWFGADKAVDGVDLTVVSGEIHALVGLNGAGKTTL